MSEYDEELQALLEHQLKPTLVLDAQGTVIATNDGILRLIRSLPLTTKNIPISDSLIGKHISDLGFALDLEDLPITWKWDDILIAAHRNSHAHECHGNHADTQTIIPGNHSSWNSDEFWDQEAEKLSLVEVDVHFVGESQSGRDTDLSAMRSDSQLKARANVRWHRQGQGVFLVILDRPSLPHRPKNKPAPAMKHAQCTEQSWLMPSCCSSCAYPESGLAAELQSPSNAAEITASLIPYIMATCNTEGLVMHFSKSWYSFSGLTKADSLGAAWITAMHPDDVQRMQSSWMDVLSNELPQWSTEARFRRASDGKYYGFLIRAQPYRDATGKILRWYTSMMDIDEWVTARQEAERRRQAILTLFSNSGLTLWGVDKSDHVYLREGGLRWSPPDMVECPESTLQEQRMDLMTTGSDDDEKRKLRLAVRAILHEPGSISTVEHRECQRYFRTMFVAERAPFGVDGSGKPAVRAALALTFEITDEKKQEVLMLENEKLTANEKAANEANDLKSRFLANMSHEIRTPISGIIGLSEHLLSCKLNQEQKELSNDIHETAQFLLHLVNDILDLSKLDSGKMRIESIPFSLNQVIRDTLVPLQFQADGKKLELKWKCDIETEDLLLGDPSRVRQILTNLLSNSLKFTQSGRVSLSVSGVPSRDREAVNAQFVVHDTGIGISKEAIDKLFKPFSQADASTARIYGGTGLGLTICRELVGLMGGQISLKSTLGEGTTVTCGISFSLHRPTRDARRPSVQLTHRLKTGDSQEAPTITQHRTQVSPQAQHPQTEVLEATNPRHLILIVDDNPINRKINSLFVKKFGHDVALACDGQEALDYLCRTSGNSRPAMVFMDCMMPVVDGYDATHRIRNDAEMFDEQTRALPIVALTASALQSDRDRCWEAGMNDCIGRPVRGRELKAAVLKWTSSEPQES
ncbi:hypothetical protein EKO04_000984 [Ascochyta lentis]|uniref:Uncharacterized protein n=1 Tax=Ascochyta lentis TaxID=205686 RepID=A0A8H7JDY2_9PLEO|nr:hypothetical protein EKO04_000984 [Ascochyta lentis]